MPRYFMPANLKKRDVLQFLELQEDGELYAHYKDSPTAGVSQSFSLVWVEKQVASGVWVEMPLSPVFAKTGETALVIERSATMPTDRNFIPLYAARILHGLGHHDLAKALYATTDAAALKEFLEK
jgi:hypothetical protein